MFCYFRVNFIIFFDNFSAVSALDNADDILFLSIRNNALQSEKIFIIGNIIYIRIAQKTFPDREIMQRIQNIGFSYAIISRKAVNLRRKIKICRKMIFKILYRETLDEHTFFEIKKS